MKKALALISLNALFLTNTVVAQENTATTPSGIRVSQEDKEKITPLQLALEDALDAFEKEYPKAEIFEIEIELLRSNDYKVEFSALEDDFEIEVAYSTKDKDFVKEEREKTRDKEIILDLEKVMTVEEANEIANKEVDLTQAVKWNLDNLGNQKERPCWKVEYEDALQEAEVVIDAITGEVISAEVETDD